MTASPSIHIIGAGLAGSEAALQLAKRGFHIRLYDMKPKQMSPAHHSTQFAEIVCSNSFGSQNSDEDVTASGLLKEEISQLGCELLKIAHQVAVPAGKALAVDRERFAAKVTEAIQANPLIECIAEDITELPSDADAILIATGPLTSAGLIETISKLLEREQLYFFDAAAPIITKDSINFDIAFYQNRYDHDHFKQVDGEAESAESIPREEGGSYINCPLDKTQYEALVNILLNGEKTELKSFEKESACFFESCMPVEVIASRGPETLRFGPMKPVGLIDPHTEKRPHAVVQLRQDNAEGTLYNLVGFQTNLKWGVQKEMIQLIPGLENAEVIRFGVMHRNTYIHSPEVLQATLQLKKHPKLFFAGQLTGTEGYTESIATGMLAAINISRLVSGESPKTPPKECMLGALLHYITRPEAIQQSFQPINSNWGILPSLPDGAFKRKDKKARNRLYAERSRNALAQWIQAERILAEGTALIL